MKKYFLSRLNVALGSLSLLLAGCHTQKNATNAENTVMAIYGVMVEDYQPVPEGNNSATDTTATVTPQDSADTNERQAPAIMVKYGVMRP